ncbi:hypothetical protein G7084_07975 [Weissella coleopterorum]|uniref:Uncharacterized protein n=1 Tax=Weissella coleopterorum TaxID=2714949 RepID=A0A6G8B1W6_9LACO|nr:hypothetical protein [Weissella coleopterorum]QIL51227.1 hypothetical protein G7084_07975 [Weissella coleopterorum]
MAKISLELPDAIYQRIQANAKYQQLSPEDYAIGLLKEVMAVKSDVTFEARQFRAKQVAGNKFDREHALVLVDGINYRYELIGGDVINPTDIYEVVSAQGNVLKIKKMED